MYRDELKVGGREGGIGGTLGSFKSCVTSNRDRTKPVVVVLIVLKSFATSVDKSFTVVASSTQKV